MLVHPLSHALAMLQSLLACMKIQVLSQKGHVIRRFSALVGWKANPVEFDSVFNRSRHTVAFGSPDIVPIFCGGLSNTHWKSYSHEFEDFATDASFLDDWAFDRFEEFLNESRHNTTLAEQIDGDGLIVFLHLLGCDTNGHAHRPYSDIYLNNINLVDRGVKSTVKVMEEYFPDGQTSYIFTADHGMSNKGRSPSVSMQ
jgi:phosphatidylinositol glycan class N